MADHIDVVLSRFKNMLTRIITKDADFDDLCRRHAELTSEIRALQPDLDASQGQRDQQLRKNRAALEEQMFAIMQSNMRI
ncbi:MAG: hypothetical protein QNJ67_08640 [Kiloniellales bacterium]|nr:hypothetical protein [Kiloniellales bacterium]